MERSIYISWHHLTSGMQDISDEQRIARTHKHLKHLNFQFSKDNYIS